jgi:hypothetical protein
LHGPDVGGPQLEGKWMTRTEALRLTFSRSSARRSLIVAIGVGTVLNLINQGDALWSGNWPVLWKACLTYCVPFGVASYGSYAAFRQSKKSNAQ